MAGKPSRPPWLVQGGAIVVGSLLVFHVVFDALNTGYQNPNLSLALLGGFGLALGWRKSYRDGDE